MVSRIGLPLSMRLDEGEGLEVRLHPVGDPVEDVGPVGGRGAVPAEGGGVRRVEGLVDVLVGGARHLAQRLAGDRGRVDEVLPRGRGDVLARDPVVVAGADRDLGLEAGYAAR